MIVPPKSTSPATNHCACSRARSSSRRKMITSPKQASTATSGNRYGSASGSVKRMTMCVATHSPRNAAPYVRETLESSSERWMNSAANPAGTSSAAGMRARSSRLRALFNLPDLELADEILGVRVGAELVIGEDDAPVAGDLVDGHAAAVVARVELDAGRQLVGQAAVDRHGAAGVEPDE